MNDLQAALQEKLGGLLREVAEVEVELSRAEGAIVGLPRSSVIESAGSPTGSAARARCSRTVG